MTEETLSRDEILFINFISMLSTSALQQLGKLVNPITNKIEKSLEGAKATIDLIDLIKKKTVGNLTANEEKVLTNSLSMLQLNYVDEVNDAKRESKEANKPEETADQKEEKK